MAMTGTNGQTAMQFHPTKAAGGANTWRGITNNYQVVRQVSDSIDSTTTWTAAGGTFGPADASNSNRVTYFDCHGTLSVDATVTADISTAAGIYAFGLCLNSTSCTPRFVSAYELATRASLSNPYSASPTLGLNYLQWVEENFSSSPIVNGNNSGIVASVGY